MLQNKLSLNEIVKRLNIYAESFGKYHVSSFGYSSDHYHTIDLYDDAGKRITLSIPMYENMISKKATGFSPSAATKQFVLISACDQTVDPPRFFDSFEEAISVMLRDVGAALHLTPSKLMRPEERAKENQLSQFDIMDRKAWVNRRSFHSWQIFEATVKDNKITKCE